VASQDHAKEYKRDECTTAHGSSWRPIAQQLRTAGLIGPGVTLYGLRHTVAVILRECGFDERTIADALGQRTIEMARHYARGADLRPKMRGVAAAFEREVKPSGISIGASEIHS
jgi:integrase